MKIEELSIGDWVSYDECSDPVRILGMDSRNGECAVLTDSCYPSGVIGFIENVHPIPLTPEILEKNGFCPPSKNCEDHHLTVGNDEVFVYIDNGFSEFIHYSKCLGDKEYMNMLGFAHSMSVNELQHALRLAGIEKEIEI